MCIRKFAVLLTLCSVICSPLAFAQGSVDEVPFVQGQTPPNAKPGEVWCLVTHPATYKTVSESVQSCPESFFMRAVPAKFELVEKTREVCPPKKFCTPTQATWNCDKRPVTLKEESFTFEVIPAVYECVDQKVEVRPAFEEVHCVPAQYRTESKQTLVSAARSEWRKVDCNDRSATRNEGKECFGLVEIPAVYQTVCNEVLVKDSETTRTTIPAQFTTIRVQHKVKDAEVRKVAIAAEVSTVNVSILNVAAKVDMNVVPARFETYKEQVQTSPESQVRVAIPAKFEVLTKTVLDQPARMVWVRTNCDCRSVVQRYHSIPGCDEASLTMLKR